MGKIKLWIPPAWANALRKSEEIDTQCKEVADGIAKRAGEGFEVVKGSSKSRAKYIVRAATPKAYYSNRKHNTLAKAIMK